MNGTDIVFIALARWDGSYSSTAYSMAIEFSKNRRVFYVDNPYTLKDVVFGWTKPEIKRRLGALIFGRNPFRQLVNDNLVCITPRFIWPINWLPSGNIYNFFANLNDKIVFRAIQKAIHKYYIQDFNLFNSYNPFYGWYLVKKYKPKLSVYQSVDNIEHSKYISKHGSAKEIEYARRADFSITTSTALRDKLLKYNSRVYLVPNAANFSLFNSVINAERKVPSDFPSSRPVICYTGNICHRIDLDLLAEAARLHKEKTFLMIGPIELSDKEKDQIGSFPNVIFTGRKDLKELPAYLKFSDCAIIPFKKNELTKSIYPLKVNEYLAVGKPVVTTSFSADINAFSDIVFVAKDAQDFIGSIDRALASDSPHAQAERIERARQNTWEARVLQVDKLITSYRA